MIEEKKKIQSCAFTGHRTLEKDFSLEFLKNTIKKLIDDGVNCFYVGMAMGFDLLCAEIVLKLKNENVKLIACVPCLEQEKYYSERDKKRYFDILERADEIIYLSNHYYTGCMQKRNAYMVDRCDVLLCYLKKEKGGTAGTVSYCKRKYPEKEIIFI